MTILVAFHFDTKNPRQPCTPTTVFKEFCGLRWQITPAIKHEKQQTLFGIKLDCEPANQAIPDWSCDAIVEFSILPASQEPKKVVGQRRHVFRASNHSICVATPVDKLPKYSDDDGRYVAQICISMNSLSELRPMPSFVFDAPTEMSNLEVEVGKRRFYVSREFLSIYSSVLADALRSDHVAFADVSDDDFEAMLHNLYPSRKPVTVSNVLSLLRMADRFAVPILFEETNRFLHNALESREMDRSQILDLAVRYELSSLREKILSSLKNPEGIAALSAEDSYHSMSSETRALLFDNVVQMLPKQKTSLFSAFRLNAVRRNKQSASAAPSTTSSVASVVEMNNNASDRESVRVQKPPALPPKPPRVSPTKSTSPSA